MVMANDDPLSRAFTAPADPTRRAILQRLGAGEAGAVQLAGASPLTQPAITKHLKVPEPAGLIDRARDGQRRPARLHREGLIPVDDWRRRAHTEWSERLDRLEADLVAGSGGDNCKGEPRCLRPRSPWICDPQPQPGSSSWSEPSRPHWSGS